MALDCNLVLLDLEDFCISMDSNMSRREACDGIVSQRLLESSQNKLSRVKYGDGHFAGKTWVQLGKVVVEQIGQFGRDFDAGRSASHNGNVQKRSLLLFAGVGQGCELQ